MLGTNLSTTRQLPVRVPSHVHEQLEHLRQQHPLRTRRHLLHFQRRDRGHLLGREHRWAVDGDRHGVLRHGGRLGLVGRALREGSRRYREFCSRARAGWRADQAHRARRCGRRGRGLVAGGVAVELCGMEPADQFDNGCVWYGDSYERHGVLLHESKCHLAGSAAQVEHLDPRPEVAIPAPSPRVRVRHPTEVCVLRSPRVDSRSCVRRPCFSSSWGVSGRSRRVAVAATVRQRPRRRYNQRLDSRNSSPGFVRVLCESRSRLAMGVEWGVDFWSVRGWSRPLSTWLTAPPGSI